MAEIPICVISVEIQAVFISILSQSMKYSILVLSMLSTIFAYLGLGGKSQAVSTVDNQLADEGSVYAYTMKSIDGKDIPLADYKGKVLVMVNVASKCGLTPQYTELEAFYKQYKDKGVEVLGFPANNFMGQEPGTNEEIQSFCQKNYGVSFQMFEKISVKGSDKHPLYQYLTTTTKEEVSWNFQKFIVGKDGKVVASISPRTHINEANVLKLVEQELAK